MSVFSINSKEIKVSIIIPAYNAEMYIEHCAQSILHQTYQNIELIIVDDGSVDNTSVIIDQLATKDSRINVCHKQNAGVSAARNTGIELSTGDYLVFVDADDYLAPDYVNYMLSLVVPRNADFGLSTNCFILDTETQITSESIRVLSPLEATALLIGPEVVVGCWNKIFKKQFVVDHKVYFSTNLFYGEGLTFIIECAQRANKIVVGNRKVYYYRRNNETSATTKFNINNFYNGEKALLSIKEKLIKIDKGVEDMWIWHMSMFFLGAIVKVKANRLEKTYFSDYTRWKSFIKKNYLHVLQAKNLSIYRKLLLAGGIISPWMMMKLDQRRRKYIYDHSFKSK